MKRTYLEALERHLSGSNNGTDSPHARPSEDGDAGPREGGCARFRASKNGAGKTGKTPDTSLDPTSTPADYELITTPEGAERVQQWLLTRTDLALDIETYGTARLAGTRRKQAFSLVRGTIRLVQISDGEMTYLLDAAYLPTSIVTEVLICLIGKSLYLHGGIFDVPRLAHAFGVDLIDEDICDTMILSRLLRSGQWELEENKKGGVSAVQKKHDLGEVLKREIGVEIAKETDHRWGEELTEKNIKYAVEDVKHLIPLYRALYDKVLEYDLLPAYDLLRKVHTLYLRQQLRGVPFDAELFEEMRGKLDEGLEAMLDQLKEFAPEHPEGEQWSWRNKLAPDALDQYGNRVGRKGALRALELVGTSLPNLKKFTREAYLKQHDDAPLLKTLDQYLKFAELLSNAEGWLDLFYEDGRIHPSVKFFSQVTGRSAYADPPMQNIAKDIGLPGMKGTSFRDCVRAPEGSAIVKADYSAQELRILAHVTGDENLTAAFIAQADGGKDPHLIVGEKIAGKELKRKTEEGEAFRAAGKRANYGFSYGAGWRRYQQSMYEDTAEWIPDEQAEQEKRAFEDAWPGVKEWQQRFGDRSGYEDDAWFTTSFAGRKRWVSQGKEGKPGYCDRLNGPVQQGGADQLYLALGKMIDDPLPGVHLIITTHDEVVLECSDETVEKAKEWLKGHMIAAVRETIGEELATPDCVEVEEGQSWGA